MDRVSKEARSANMKAIRSTGTKPELVVRSLIHRLGYRYRLHRHDLPGRPDIVFGPRRKVIFMHGCFWHGHGDPACVQGRRQPKSNLAYWLPKLARNKERDAATLSALAAQGWSVLVVWECEIRDRQQLEKRLNDFLKGGGEHVRRASAAYDNPRRFSVAVRSRSPKT
jgi:DNA mismatch endonuclease (patch repair protein)